MHTTNWETAFARHWLFDLADELRWDLIADTAPQGLRDIAARVKREEIFQRLHAENMLDVLLVDLDARRRVIDAVTELAPLVAGLFEPVAGEATAIAEGVVTGSFSDQWPELVHRVEDRIGEISWSGNEQDLARLFVGQVGRRSRSQDWQPLMTRMREVIDLDLNAVW